MKEARIRKSLTEKAYIRAMDIYSNLKEEHNIDLLLFFKSFVYQYSRTNNIEFNLYLENIIHVQDYVINFYYPQYKKDGVIVLYDTPMNSLITQ